MEGINRENNTVSKTRKHIYNDNWHTRCKKVEPETDCGESQDGTCLHKTIDTRLRNYWPQVSLRRAGGGAELRNIW